MLFKAIASLFSSDLAIDLGTANTLVYMKGRGIVLNEPSVVAVKEAPNGIGRVMAVGKKAKIMLGRTPENMLAIRPMQNGVIADFDIVEKMLRYFIRRAHNRGAFVRPSIVVSVPSGITQVEKRAVRESAESAGAREVFLIAEPIAAAIGAGLPFTEPIGNMVVDIGGGTSEVSIISLSEIVYSTSVRGGGNKMDNAIIQYIKRNFNLCIGTATAELIKISIGTAIQDDAPEIMQVKGQDMVTGMPKILTIDSEDIRKAIQEQLEKIVEAILITLEQIQAEFAADIVDRGIVLTGGGSLLKNFDTMLRERLKLPITITEDPLTTVAVGSGKVLTNLSILRDIASK